MAASGTNRALTEVATRSALAQRREEGGECQCVGECGVVISADVDAWFNAPLPDGGSYQTFPYQPWPFAVVTPAIAAAIGATDAGIEDTQKLAMLRAKNRVQAPRRFPHG